MSGGKCPGGDCPGGNFMGGICPGEIVIEPFWRYFPEYPKYACTNEKEIVRANELPHMIKTLRKAIMKRSGLESK